MFYRSVIKFKLSDNFINSLNDFISSYDSLRNFSKAIGYSVSYCSAVLNGKKAFTDSFIKRLRYLGFELSICD